MQVRPFALILAAAVASPCTAAEKDGRYTILSMGTKSCGDVVADFKEGGPGKLSNSIWIAGYLTAVNEHIATRSNIAAGTDAEAWNLWVNNYCSANPLETLASSATALFSELSKRRR